MPSLSSNNHPAIDAKSTILKDSTVEDISQTVDPDDEKSTSHALDRSRTQTPTRKRNRSINPDNIRKSPRQNNLPNGISKRPAFAQLPYGSKDDPKASAWGLWGPKDELGTLNYLTTDVISNASKEIMTGIVIPLK